MSQTSPETVTDRLTPEHRCDRCGARALREVQMPNGLKLLFCAHHFRDNELAIAAKGGVVTRTGVLGTH